MKIRLGALEVRLSRYLGLWSLVVVVFAMQCCVNDAVNARVWSPITYLRWSGVQWLTWAGLAPLVFRLGERHPLPFPLPFHALLRHMAGRKAALPRAGQPGLHARARGGLAVDPGPARLSDQRGALFGRGGVE